MDPLVIKLMLPLSCVNDFHLTYGTNDFEIDVYRMFLSRMGFAALKTAAKIKATTLNEETKFRASKYVPSFISASLLLKYASETSFSDDVPSSESMEKIEMCAETLRELSLRAAEIHEELITTAWELISARSCPERFRRKIEEIDEIFTQPFSVSQPYHLHYTTNTAGGGNFLSVKEKVNLYRQPIFTVPEKWITSKQPNLYTGEQFLSADTCKVMQMLDKGEIDEPCFHSIRVAKIIQAAGKEAQELYLEMTMWRKLPCAMALHPRLGEGSKFGWLSQDMMKMVIKFVME